jgi:hypothetical protein
MLHEEFTACPALLHGFQTVSIMMSQRRLARATLKG